MSKHPVHLIRISTVATDIGHDASAAYWSVESREFLEKSAHDNFRKLAHLMGYRVESIRCSYCDATGDLRKHHDTGGHAPQDYVCASCFTPETDGPAFDDLAKVEAA